MKKMYLLLINSETIFTKFLRIFTKDEYNHVVFTFDDDCEKMYTYARWVTWMPILAGFEVENIGKGILKKKPLTECKIYEVNITDDQYEILGARLKPFLTKSKVRHWYNFPALAYIKLKIPYYNTRNFVCSTFVAFMIGDMIDLNKVFTHVVPNDYLDLKLPLVYEGKLAKYIDGVVGRKVVGI